jgi:hypothetical protein
MGLLLHVRMARALEGVHERLSQRRGALLKQLNRGGDALLLVIGELIPPRSKRVGVLDFPHPASITYNL